MSASRATAIAPARGSPSRRRCGVCRGSRARRRSSSRRGGPVEVGLDGDGQVGAAVVPAVGADAAVQREPSSMRGRSSDGACTLARRAFFSVLSIGVLLRFREGQRVPMPDGHGEVLAERLGVGGAPEGDDALRVELARSPSAAARVSRASPPSRGGEAGGCADRGSDGARRGRRPPTPRGAGSRRVRRRIPPCG